MQKYIKLTLVATSLMMIQGCATHSKFVKKYDAWIGHNISQFITQIGYPDSTFTLPNKNKVYVYERSRIYSIPTIMPMMGYGYRGYYGGFNMRYGTDEIVQEECKLFLETNQKGNIVKWGSRGNSCRSN